ncbi:MAG: hypothetical protein MN733_36710 [Nitrososphaera sp.]|nr:hypothetical protein [Nitrososphaera sp.]
MQAAGLLSGGAPFYKKYSASATGYVAGIYMITAADAGGGVASASTTTNWTLGLGLNMDGYALEVGAPMTYSVTQGNSVALSTIAVNPDLILRALMVGSAASAVLTDNPILTASSNGLTAVGTNSVANLDEGTIWYTSGANAGRQRVITSVSSATATVIIPFAANAVGDVFLAINASPGSVGVTMSTNLLNSLQADTALGSDAIATCLDLELNGNSNSYAHYICRENLFGNAI